MVLKRIQHKLGPLHHHLYAYCKNIGTTECISDVLSCINNKSSIVVFLDLEKAFELANPAAILVTLANKGLKGHILAWAKNYMLNRQARVKFQGEVSDCKVLENGTPQGGILSPYLFNTLVENLAQLNLPNCVDIFIYADDITLVSRGAHRHSNMQKSLNLLGTKCKELGLKVNANKTKAMAIKSKPNKTLTIGDQEIDWVNTFMYLGVCIDKKLTFQNEVKYLRERAATRLNPMKYMTSLKEGAGYNVLRTYYLATTRSIVEYAAPTLGNLTSTQYTTLEVIQNNAMRIMLGAPMWTRICNLQMETRLPSLQKRIEAKNTNIATKTLITGRNSYLKRKIGEELARHPDLPTPNTYAAHLANNFKICNMESDLANIEADKPCAGFTPPAPWEDTHAKFIRAVLPSSKSACTPTELKEAALSSIRTAEQQGGISYYTDGTVDPDTGITGAAVYSNKYSAHWRTSNHCSTLQTELVAIKQALVYSVANEQGPVAIHTDSLSSQMALQKPHIRENINLITSILSLIKQHHIQGRPVTINWLPSHVGIEGNDKADELAKMASYIPNIQIKVQPSLQQYKAQTNSILMKSLKEQHRAWVDDHSLSANWYKDVTNLEPHCISNNTPRHLSCIINRLRLGYKCNWEIVKPRNRDCSHCNEDTINPLFHYLLECPQTQSLRLGLFEGLDEPNNARHPEARERAITVTKRILGDLDGHQGTLLSFPRPR